MSHYCQQGGHCITCMTIEIGQLAHNEPRHWEHWKVTSPKKSKQKTQRWSIHLIRHRKQKYTLKYTHTSECKEIHTGKTVNQTMIYIYIKKESGDWRRTSDLKQSEALIQALNEINDSLDIGLGVWRPLRPMATVWSLCIVHTCTHRWWWCMVINYNWITQSIHIPKNSSPQAYTNNWVLVVRSKIILPLTGASMNKMNFDRIDLSCI